MADIHPALLSARTVGVVGNATPQTSQQAMSGAKTIGQLESIKDEVREYIRSFLLPSEFTNELDQNTNFKISVGDILDALNLADLGLDKVSNTSDEEKPLSRAMIEALSTKYDAENFKVTTETVEGLEELLQAYRLKNVKISLEEVNTLVEALANKADKTHTHSIDDVNGLRQLLNGLSPSTHTHSLSSLTGWNDFLTQLNQQLALRPTTNKVNELIDNRAVIVGINEWE